MSNLARVLESIAGQDDDSLTDIHRSLARSAVMSAFCLSRHKLDEMFFYMIKEMRMGLKSVEEGKSTLRMLTSFVKRKETNTCSGLFYAVDLGGTNLRIIKLVLQNGKIVQSAMLPAVAVPDNYKCGFVEELFQYVADAIIDFSRKNGDVDPAQTIPVGFAFSFILKLHALNSGTLLGWDKGFALKDGVGQDVAALLQRGFESRGEGRLKVVALCDDTVGTLITCQFAGHNARVGAVIGTGMNICYWERCSNIVKDPQLAASSGINEEVAVNTEFGGFDSSHLVVLPPYCLRRGSRPHKSEPRRAAVREAVWRHVSWGNMPTLPVRSHTVPSPS